MGAEVFHALKKQLKEAGHNTNVGDEGGFAPNLQSAEEALDFIMKAIESGGLQAGQRRRARARSRPRPSSSRTASTSRRRGQDRSTAPAWSNYLADLVARYPDRLDRRRLAEDDWDGWKLLTDELGGKVPARRRRSLRHQPERLREGIEKGIANSILVKVNQIGTLTETLDAVEMAQRAGYTAVMLHRSGETEDSTIADLAVATNCGQIKTGSLSRSDRLAKYNQLLRIEEELGAEARYLGRAVLKR